MSVEQRFPLGWADRIGGSAMESGKENPDRQEGNGGNAVS